MQVNGRGSLGCFLVLLLGSLARSAAPNEPMLIFDLAPKHEAQPYHFRSSQDDFQIEQDPPPSRTNLDRLNASGSAQFSAESLPEILKKIPTDKVTVVDLRRESHGFVNGRPVSWWVDQNAGNTGKSLEEIEQEEKSKLDALAQAGAATINEVVKDDVQKTIQNATPTTVQVESAAVEADVCQALQVEHFRSSVADDHRPDDAEVDRFVEFVTNLPLDRWLHFHCENGHGRTTTFLVLYDMLRNAKEVGLEDIVRRQWCLGGVDVLDVPSEDSWKYEFSVERAAFVKKFYDYCQADTQDFQMKWSTWVQGNP